MNISSYCRVNRYADYVWMETS